MTVEKIIDEIVKLCGICLDFSPDTPKKYNVVDFVYDYDKQLEKIKKIIEDTKKELEKTRNLQKIDPNIGNLFVG